MYIVDLQEMRSVVKSKRFVVAVNRVIDQETQSIFTTKSARERNEQFIQSHSKTLDHRLVGKLPKHSGYLYYIDRYKKLNRSSQTTAL